MNTDVLRLSGIPRSRLIACLFLHGSTYGLPRHPRRTGRVGLLLWCGRLTHKILIEPGDGAPDGVNLVLAFHEAMTFIRVIVNIYDPAFFLEDVYDLLRLLLGDARVVVAL